MKKTAEKKHNPTHAHAHPHKKPRNQEEKQVAAYYEWQLRGEPIGDDFTDWDVVERRWEDENGNSLDIIEEENS